MTPSQYAETTLFVTKSGFAIHAWHRPGTNDWNTLFSILSVDEYWLTNEEGMVGVDIGAHIGGCSLLMLSMGWTVVAVEPLEENIELIAASADLNGWSDRLTILHGAVGADSSKPTRIYYGDPETETGRVHKFVGSDEGSGTDFVDVSTYTMADIQKVVGDRRIDVMKIDCEGGEWPFFTTEGFDNVGTIVAELHRGDQLRQRALDLLGGSWFDASPCDETDGITLARLRS